MLEFLKAPFLVLYFSFYTIMDFMMISFVRLLSVLTYTVYCKSDQTSDIWQQLGLASEHESDLQDTVD